MADITMCEGGDCPLKENCYRYKAPVSEYRQAYFMYPPYVDGECKEFWSVEGRRLEGMK